jgi:hypothetical protein
MHLWPENEVWERLNSLNRLLSELGTKHAFSPEFKITDDVGFKKYPFSFFYAHSTHIHYPSTFPAMGTKLRLEIVIILPYCG